MRGDDHRWMTLMLSLRGSRVCVFVHRELGRGGVRSNVGRNGQPRDESAGGFRRRSSLALGLHGNQCR